MSEIIEDITAERPTKKQQEVLDFVTNFIDENDIGPTLRDVMRGLGHKSVSTAATHVDGLIAKGLLKKSKNKARSLQIVSSRVNKVAGIGDNVHLDWLRMKIEEHKAAKRLGEVAILNDALRLLDQTEKEQI